MGQTSRQGNKSRRLRRLEAVCGATTLAFALFLAGIPPAVLALAVVVPLGTMFPQLLLLNEPDAEMSGLTARPLRPAIWAFKRTVEPAVKPANAAAKASACAEFFIGISLSLGRAAPGGVGWLVFLHTAVLAS